MSPSYPQVRRRQPKSGVGASFNRDSNAVRASVLATALELGIAQNPTVANWIFNTPLAEVPEDVPELGGGPEPEAEPEESLTPALTCGSNTTSDESSSLNSPRNNASSGGVNGLQVHTRKPSATEPPHVHFEDFSSDQLQLFSPLGFSSFSPAPASAEKIEGLGKKFKESERALNEDSLRHSRSHESPSPAEIGYSSEGQSLSQGKGGKKEKKVRKLKPNALELSKGEDRETDYTSDGGYLSASSNKSQGKSPSKGKSRAIAFFRRRPKKSHRGSDDEDEDVIPPVPAIPMIPKPSSPKPLKHHVAAPSPTRTGFTPLTLNFSSPSASPPRQRASKSPPPLRVAATSSPPPPRLSEELPQSLQRPPSVTAPDTLNPAAATLQVPSPTPLLGPTSASASSSTAAGLPSKSTAGASSRHHHPIPPPAPPPTFPLPQPPSPHPSMPSRSVFSSFTSSSAPTTPSRHAPLRPVPSLPTPTAPALTPPILQTPPLTARKGSPFRSSQPGVQTSANLDHVHSRQIRDETDHAVDLDHELQGASAWSSSKDIDGGLGKGPQIASMREQAESLRQRGSAPIPMFLQRRIHAQQHVYPSSPRHPPPDTPLPQVPPTPSPTPSARSRTPVNLPSKFHEHFSSVSSVPLSHILSAPSASPTSSMSRSGSSGPSVRSLHTSSTPSEHSNSQHSASHGTSDSRPVTSSSSISEASYGQVVTATSGTPRSRLVSRFSDRSELSISVYPPTSQDSASIYDDDADVEEAKDGAIDDDDDDDASVYPSEEQTAGRRTMYLVEHGHLDESGDEVFIGSHFWKGGQPLPPLPTHPRPGYF